MKYCIRYFEMKGFPKRKREGFMVIDAKNVDNAFDKFVNMKRNMKKHQNKYLLDIYRKVGRK